MPTTTFNLGSDSSLVIISPLGGRVDLSIVEAFEAKQMVHKLRIRPLNGPTQGADIPDGWEGSITLERGSSGADALFSQIEAGFFAGGIVGTGQIYQFVEEVNGSTSTFTFNNVTMNLSEAGSWKADATVKQTIMFFASTRSGP